MYVHMYLYVCMCVSTWDLSGVSFPSRHLVASLYPILLKHHHVAVCAFALLICTRPDPFIATIVHDYRNAMVRISDCLVEFDGATSCCCSLHHAFIVYCLCLCCRDKVRKSRVLPPSHNSPLSPIYKKSNANSSCVIQS